MSQRGITATLTLAAILMLAGIVHIASLLLLPRVAPDDAYTRLATFARDGGTHVLPRAGESGDPLPDRDPSVATAVCLYDLAEGPLRVTAGLGGGNFVAMSMHARSGLAYYALDDKAENEGKLEIVVMTSDQRDAAEARDSAGAPRRDLRVVAPESRGFVSFDVLPRIGGYPSARRALASMGCRVEHPL